MDYAVFIGAEAAHSGAVERRRRAAYGIAEVRRTASGRAHRKIVAGFR